MDNINVGRGDPDAPFKPEKFVYFNNTSDIVASEIAEYIKTIGYTPITGGGDIDFFEPYKDGLVGAVLANPPVMHGEIESTTDEMWNNARESFVVPMLNITQVVGEIFMQNKKGSIIYLNSIHAEKPIGNGFLYTMGCAAVQMLCREAALIYGSYNVGCYNVMRGIVEGEESYFASEYSPIHHSSELRFPKEKLPSAKSLNELCAFLLSGGAYILNGTDLQADEGFRLYYGKSGYYK
ncbi:MAG: SDR family oxidoreductase [Oscillospiraceae bacterium]|nr:SDR family oxidoreductase [Oscillospiraceae bacterium]